VERRRKENGKNMKREPITHIGYEKLMKDLRFLKEIEIPENIKDIKISASYGDLTENAEYEAAKERQEFLLMKIDLLEKINSEITIIDPSKNSHTTINFGSTFEIENIETGEELKYTIVGGYEANPTNGTISYNSPLSRFFLRKEEDDEVTVNIGNKISTYEIQAIYFDKNIILKNIG
jgi:transcription elongation factor GreA